MSTKIYNAYKINDLSLPEIMEKLQLIRKRNFEAIQERLSQVGKVAIDGYCVEKNISFTNMLRKEATSSISTEFNFGFDVVLYFHKTDVYIQFFENELNVDYEKIFDGKLEDFHYQNQSDPWYDYKDDLSSDEIKSYEKNWEHRCKVWDEILDYGGVPSQCGLTFNVYSADDSFTVVYTYYERDREKLKGEINV